MRAVVDRFNQASRRLRAHSSPQRSTRRRAGAAIAGVPRHHRDNSENVATYAEARTRCSVLDELALAAGLSLDMYARGMRQMQHQGPVGVDTGGTLAMYHNRRLFAQAGLIDKPPGDRGMGRGQPPARQA